MTTQPKEMTDAEALAVLDAVAHAKRMIAGIVQPLGDAHPIAAILIPDVTQARATLAAVVADAERLQTVLDRIPVLELNNWLDADMEWYERAPTLDEFRAAIDAAITAMRGTTA